jgi:NADH:ubiquinone oxidoreductase subunit 5 (subunit L)/multisubunit Na+/H+ antiporter MnhA subunit
MGFFFLLCFFSKDRILEGFPSFQKNLCKILLNISLIFTFLYSFRLIFFFLKNNKNKTILFKKKKVSLLFFLSMIFLFLKVLFFGIHFNYYIIEFFFSSKILKIYILIILIFCFLS